MKCGMGVPPMIAFSHGQDARATGNSSRSKQERHFSPHPNPVFFVKHIPLLTLSILIFLCIACVGYRNRTVQKTPLKTETVAPQSATVVKIIDGPAVTAWLESKPWRAPETVFPFFLDHAFTGKDGAMLPVNIQADGIEVMRKSFTGRVRLEALSQAFFKDDQATLIFEHQQNLPLKASFGLAALSISQQIIMRASRQGPIVALPAEFTVITHPDSSTQAVCKDYPPEKRRRLFLTVVDGGMRVNFSGILRLFVPKYLPDVQMQHFEYTEFSPEHASLSSWQDRHFSPENIVVEPNQKDGTVIFHLSDDGFGAPPPITVTSDKILLGRSAIEMTKDQNTWREKILSDPNQAISKGLILRTTGSYEMRSATQRTAIDFQHSLIFSALSPNK